MTPQHWQSLGAIVISVACLLVWAVSVLNDRWQATKRRIDAMVAHAGNLYPDDIDDTRNVVVTRQIWHPVFGACEQTWVEPSPARVAEEILRAEADA